MENCGEEGRANVISGLKIILEKSEKDLGDALTKASNRREGAGSLQRWSDELDVRLKTQSVELVSQHLEDMLGS